MNRPLITPQMKVGDFLDAFPELEATLISISPAFRKLKNPLLRRTIARVATLQQAALTGDVPIHDVIRQLREKAGQSLDETVQEAAPPSEAADGMPEWLLSATSREEFDAIPILDSGAHPLQEVFKRLQDLSEGTVLDLITPFHPAPLIEAVRKNGWQTCSHRDEAGRFITSIGAKRKG